MAEVVVKTYRTADAKTFFANERTFLHWLTTSVTLGSIAAGLIGVAAKGNLDSSNRATLIVTRLAGLGLLATAILIAVLACFNFYTRGAKLKAMSDGPYDSGFLVGFFACIMLLILAVTWITAIARLAS